MVESTNESFGGKLARGEGEFRLPRAIVLLLLLGGSVYFGWNFKRLIDFREVEPIVVPPVPRQHEEDTQRLEALIERYRGTMEARRGSRHVVASVTDRNRRPFEMTLPRRAAEAAAAAAAAGADPATVVIEPVVEEVLPPIMFVRAIMVSGKDSIAIMDINGVGNGIIVKTGYTFLGKQGRIVRISPEKVTVRWIDKNIDIAPGI